jgi:hypothetical protein
MVYCSMGWFGYGGFVCISNANSCASLYPAEFLTKKDL